MQTEQPVIDKLLEFKQRDKFSANVWKSRGLNPSGHELCKNLTQLFNSCAGSLIQAINTSVSSRQLKAILKKELSKFKETDYDTEEKEFICDLFHELSAIINIDFNDNLNSWLYGPVLAILIKAKKKLIPKKIIETIQQPCTNCSTALESFVMQREKGIAESGWYLVRCKNCKAFNLLSCGPDIKELKFGNYEYIETFRKSEYSYEQAMNRLEQVQFFRK